MCLWTQHAGSKKIKIKMYKTKIFAMFQLDLPPSDVGKVVKDHRIKGDKISKEIITHCWGRI